MTTTYLIENIDELLLNEFKQIAKKMGRDVFIKPFNEKDIKKSLRKENNEVLESSLNIHNEPKTLAGVLLSIPKLDLEDDFFDIPQEPMREMDWNE